MLLSRLERAKPQKDGFTALCPAHKDRNPSLSVREGDDGRALVTCHAGCTLDEICAALGVPMAALFAPGSTGAMRRRHHGARSRAPLFSPGAAGRGWRAARARARDDESAIEDAAVYEYLRKRGLEESWNTPGFGVLGPGMDLPKAIRRWPESSHRLVLPLYDQEGRVASLQARCIRQGAKAKVLFPSGSAVKGCVFANGPGVALLCGRLRPPCTIIFGEGLTDFLAIACAASGYAVLAAPGTGFVKAAIGRWGAGTRVVIAMDNDEAGSICTRNVVPQLYHLGAKDVFRVIWPQGCKDACDLVRQVGMVGLQEFIAKQMGEIAPR